MSSGREFSYDGIADAYAARVEDAPFNALYERPAMLDLLPPLDGLRVLDAGCGSGIYAGLLMDRGALVTGIDESAAMVEHARRRLAGRDVELRVADLRAPLPFADGSFDGIVSALVLHYLRDWAPTLAEFRRVLRPGGWLAFSTHHPAAEARYFDVERYLEVEPLEDTWDRVGTVRFYRRPVSRIVNDLADAGFAMERMVEPLPTEAFRQERPDAYRRMLRQPNFLMIRARPRPRWTMRTMRTLLLAAVLAGCGGAQPADDGAKTAGPSAAGSAARVDSACLPYTPETVTITGRLERRTYYGPPGFGEAPAVDDPRPGFYVVPDAPVCTRPGRDVNNDARRGIALVQMVLDSAGYAGARPYLETRVRATGSLSAWITGYHHAELLLAVDSIVPADGPR